jgi:hypothetical protein
MTTSASHAGTKTRPVPRSLASRILTWLAIGLFALLFAEDLLRGVYLMQSDENTFEGLRNLQLGESYRQSPGIQPIAFLQITRHYGWLSRHQPPDWTVHGVVIWENGKYWLVRGNPKDLFRSLLDPEKYPNLATEPLERDPISATDENSVLQEARASLEHWLDTH